MKSSLVKVYIATTQGLVEIQSITELHDPELRSVVTIKASSQLAGISQDYADFVQAPQGLLSAQFGGSAYRANLSADINQGTSWHLGMFVAHYMKANGLYANGLNAGGLNTHAKDANDSHQKSSLKPKLLSQRKAAEQESDYPTELIIIASGEINTLTLSVSSITQLDKKCALANARIKQWQLQGKKVLFLVPTDNYREPTPDSSIQLTPISTLTQLPHLCDLIGLKRAKTFPFELAQEPTYLVNQGQEKLLDVTSIQNKDVSSSSENTDSDAIGSDQAVVIEAIERSKGLRATILKKSVLIALFMWLVISLFLYIGISSDTKKQNVQLAGLDYQYVALLSENRASCSLAKEMALAQPYPNPYVAMLNGGDSNGVSQLASILQLPASNAHNLCALTLVTSQQIKAVWLLDESASLLDLSAIVTQSNNREWSIALPSNQSENKHYHLLLFIQDVDAADKQSLQSELQRLQAQGQVHSLVSLSQWATQLAIPTIFIEHALVLPK